jgi:cytolysin-activating lysine-acyltransferase
MTEVIQKEILESNPIVAKKSIVTVPSILGDMVWLKMQTKESKYTFVNDLEWQLLPPIHRKQFRLFRTSEKPLGYVTWASINEETEVRIKSGNLKLAPSEWSNGDRLWLIEHVSPFGGAKQSLIDLYNQVFKGKDVHLLVSEKFGKPAIKSLFDLISEFEKEK